MGVRALTLKDNIDNFRIDVESNSQFIDKILKDIIGKYCKDLDEAIDKIREMLYSNPEQDWTTAEYEDVAMKLSLLLYYTSSAQENVGIRSDISNSLKTEKYNRILISTNGTAVEKKSQAELSTQVETIVSIASTRAYKMIQSKVQVGFELLAVIKKILSRRISEPSQSV